MTWIVLFFLKFWLIFATIFLTMSTLIFNFWVLFQIFEFISQILPFFLKILSQFCHFFLFSFLNLTFFFISKFDYYYYFFFLPQSLNFSYNFNCYSLKIAQKILEKPSIHFYFARWWKWAILIITNNKNTSLVFSLERCWNTVCTKGNWMNERDC